MEKQFIQLLNGKIFFLILKFNEWLPNSKFFSVIYKHTVQNPNNILCKYFKFKLNSFEIIIQPCYSDSSMGETRHLFAILIGVIYRIGVCNFPCFETKKKKKLRTQKKLPILKGFIIIYHSLDF